VFGFLLSRRWVLFGIAVAVLGVACWRLGEWQFDRLQERRADNAVIERNLAAEPVDVREVMTSEADLPHEAQWRTVTMRGTYDEGEQVLVRYQTRDGQAGVTVVTPLRFSDGTQVLVERGWEPAPNTASAEVDVPAPPDGSVTVHGWARPDQSGDSDEITPADGQVRLISSEGFEDVVDGPLLDGYVSVDSEQPPPSQPLTQGPQMPELDSGPHFFYGLQWWFFGLLAVGGFGYFAYLEARDRRRSR